MVDPNSANLAIASSDVLGNLLISRKSFGLFADSKIISLEKRLADLKDQLQSAQASTGSAYDGALSDTGAIRRTSDDEDYDLR